MASGGAVLPRKLAHALAQEKPARREQARAQEVPQQAAARETIVQAHSTEERVSVLEARWEETIPALATKTDLAELRTELAQVKSDLVKWALGIAASVLVAFIGLLFASHHSTNTRFDQVNVRIDQLQSETNARFDQLQSDTNGRFDQVNARIDQLQNETNARFDQMNARLDRLFELIASQQAASKSQ
ncbi:hypothetical protein AXK11_00950 [Cephaloticoccus primus]|uniref:Uncharacterized protein n=1 Tax=Cephaloticoccus primus TaxID=1548207 RepID=A0A139SUW5_9BACT|nr:hypothetical protein [Cephaloticoccus primus]KXU38240.1 hypothetical protein AXK11_00950 [Cephaloticoccus primus]